MEETIPQKHRDLLNMAVESLVPDDERFVRKSYARLRDSLRTTETKLYAELFHNLEKLDTFLDKPDSTKEHQRNVALAAITYFVQTNDVVNDDHTSGLIDDAIVVRAAMLELNDVL